MCVVSQGNNKIKKIMKNNDEKMTKFLRNIWNLQANLGKHLSAKYKEVYILVLIL